MGDWAPDDAGAVRRDGVWVLVPFLNEAAALREVIDDLHREFAHVLCVDDGSTDGSGAIAAAAGATVLRHAVNLGQGAALQTGFDFLVRHTDATHVVTFDADGQHQVRDAVQLVEVAVRDSVDVVLASRFIGQAVDIPRTRRWLLQCAVAFSRRTTALPLTDTHNGLRVLNRRAFAAIKLRQPRMAYASELENAIVPLGLSCAEVPTTVIYTDYSRAKGQSNANAVNILFDLAWHKILRAS